MANNLPPSEASTAFRLALAAWYRAHRRALPWRESPSPYATVVSEFMLQQTQVRTVLPYFARWIERLPDWQTLAAADEDTVLKLWEGLGYYSRARRLQKLARAVIQRAALPRTAASWAELPGVGPYTAAAVASIAFGEPAACVDGNVVRVLARLTGTATVFSDGQAAARHFAPLAQSLLDPAAPGDHNQAMMELGATLCRKREPDCRPCPVRGFCAAGQAGSAAGLPRIEPKSTERVACWRAWCERDGTLLLHRQPPGSGRLAGLYELPRLEQLLPGIDPADAGGEVLARKQRSITRFRITETIVKIASAPSPPGEQWHWLSRHEIKTAALSGPHRRWIGEIWAAADGGGF